MAEEFERLGEKAQQALQDVRERQREIERSLYPVIRPQRYGVPPTVFTIIFALGWVVLAAISLGVIGAVIWSYLAHGEAKPPETLTNWGGVIIGFYFGHFFSFLRDAYPYSKEKERPEAK